jgi:hypothetical protein
LAIDVVADPAVVADVAARHQHVAVADDRRAATLHRPAADRHGSRMMLWLPTVSVVGSPR